MLINDSLGRPGFASGPARHIVRGNIGVNEVFQDLQENGVVFPVKLCSDLTLIHLRCGSKAAGDVAQQAILNLLE